MTARGIRRFSAIAVLGLVVVAGRAPNGTRPALAQPAEAYVRVATWSSDPAAAPPGAFLEPRGVTVDPYDGTVYVVDGGNHRVQVFEADGTFLRTLGAPAGEAALADPQDVATQGSLVFITDAGRGRVALFTVEGDYVGQWTGLDLPWGIASAADGRVFVVENGANRVAVFRADGRRVATWAGTTGGVFGLNRPHGADVTRDGRLVVADTGNDRLVAFDRDGLPQTESGRATGVGDVAVDPAGSLYTVHADGTVRRFDDVPGFPADARTWALPGATGIGAAPDGAIFTSFQDDLRPLHGVQRWTGRPLAPDVIWGGVPAPLGRIDAPTRLAAAADVLVVDSWRRAQRFTPDGRPVGQVPIGRVNDLTMGPGGSVHVVRDGEVERLGPDGARLWRSALPATAGEYAWGVALDWDEATDRLAVLDMGGQQVQVLDGQGQAVGGWSFRPGPGAQAMMWDIARAPGGYFLVNRKAATVERRGATGDELATWPVPGGPVRVASDRLGYAFVLNRYGWVWKYDRDGGLRAVWWAGTGDPGTSQPSDLAVDAQGRVLVTDLRANQVAVFAPDPSGPAGAVPSFDPACHARGDKRADPTRLTLGDEATITLAVRGDCPATSVQPDIALVIDHSGSMSPPGKLDAAQAAARMFLDTIDFNDARVAVVGFNQDARLLQGLTANKANAIAAIAGLVAGGGTDIGRGLDVARGELVGPRRRLSAASVLVLITDGGSDPAAATRAADQAKLEGIRVFTIGFGADAATALLQGLATAPTDYYFAPDGSGLASIYGTIASRVSAQVLFATLTVMDVLPVNMAYVNGSGRPAPMLNGQTLVWQLADVPLAGLDLSYRVRPREPGLWPTNVSANGQGTDGLGQRGQVTFPVPAVLVEARTTTAAPPPTATATTSPSPSPTATATPSPRVAVYLPLASRLACLQRRQHVDVVLVLDTSDSMLDPAPGGGTKLMAALAAARGFVGLLDLPADGAAVVYFNAQAAVWQALTHERGALNAALGGLPQGPGTRIDLGLQRAAEALAGPNRSVTNLPVVVLLTDGRPTGTTDDTVVQAAAALQGNRVTLYVIGLGADVDRGLLARVASDANHLVLAPDAAALARIYADIARELPCLGP
jgi:Mg-chelatase subunit ChlD/DNA-binding beta-propeller fold protein YncE